MKYDVVIDGKVLEAPLNGIPRYAWEIIKELDHIENLPYEIAVLVPSESTVNINFKRLHFIKLRAWDNDIFYALKAFKRLAHFVWRFTGLKKFAEGSDALYINFTSAGIKYKKSVVTIHDIRPLAYGEGKKTIKSGAFIAIFYFAVKTGLRNSKLIVTDSEFSKKEIVRYFNYNNVNVIGCGWEHMNSIVPDESIFERYPKIKKGEYYFSVSSIAPHKNFDWIVKNAAINPQNQYVIVGRTDPKMWSEDTSKFRDNIIWLGFQSDETVKALLQSAKALVFPSKYEGFGIPPLEALAVGTPAIVSDIPVMREIYGDSVNYINPEEPNVVLEIIETEIHRKAREEVLKKYTWKNAARQWLEIIYKNV